jgi:hypothetical protein
MDKAIKQQLSDLNHKLDALAKFVVMSLRGARAVKMMELSKAYPSGERANLKVEIEEIDAAIRNIVEKGEGR